MIEKTTGAEYAELLISHARKREKLLNKINRTKSAKRREKLEGELCEVDEEYKALIHAAYEVR